MLRRSHMVVLIAAPLIAIIVAWVFCLQENLQHIAQDNVWLEENLRALQQKLDRFDRGEENGALRMAKSESEQMQESTSPARNRIITGDFPVDTVHVVQAGENLHTIGMKYGISWTALVKHNSLDRPNRIYAGQELKIPWSRTRIVTPSSIHGAPHSRLH